MIGVDLQEEPDLVERFGKKYGVSSPLVIEEDERMRKVFGIRGCPATVLIDRNGRMVGRSGGGEADWSSEAARALVRSLLGIPQTGPGESVPAGTGAKHARKAVHLVSAVAPNDPKLNDILDEAAASLKAGDEVVILFDGQSVGALRTNNSRTSLQEAEFTKKQRRVVARRLGIPESVAPRDQFHYIERLAKAGAKVLVNVNAIRAFGLSDDEIHPLARRIAVEEMEKMVDDSDACLTYSRD